MSRVKAEILNPKPLKAEPPDIVRVGMGSMFRLELLSGGDLWLSPYSISAVYDHDMPQAGGALKCSVVQLEGVAHHEERGYLCSFIVKGSARDVVYCLSEVREEIRFRRRRRRATRRPPRRIAVRRRKSLEAFLGTPGRKGTARKRGLK